MKYWIKIKGRDHGPLTAEEIVSQFKDSLTPDLPCAKNGEDKWSTLGEVIPDIASMVLPDRPQTITNSATKRYSDAYIVANTIAMIGGIVKLIALILGVCIAIAAIIFAAIALTQDNPTYGIGRGIAGILVAVVVTIPIYVLGLLLAAQGQILKATLDTAVTNSPFLKKEEMAKVMSL